MRLPYMQTPRSKSKEYTVGFLGLNYGAAGGRDGEFAETENLSCAEYPCLTQRQGRETVAELSSPQALFGGGGLVYVDGTSLYSRDGETGEFVLRGAVTAGEKQFAAVNSKIVIWPDKLTLDTMTGELSPMEISETRSVVFAGDGSEATIRSEGEPFSFRAGDGVKVTGCQALGANNDVTAIIRAVSEDGRILSFDPLIFEAGAEGGATLSREIPGMDYICAHNNRLFGCGGGTVYASALGQPENFNVFDGLSTDSYAVAVGSGGEFTGCVGYGSMQVLFFKEHIVHPLVGTKPANYSLDTQTFMGIRRGCHKSAVVINEVLYYMSPVGLMSYAGSAPVAASEALGLRRFGGAVAGTDGVRYYVSMRDDDTGAWGFYAYDTKKRLWLREDGTHALDMALFQGRVQVLDAGGRLFSVGGGQEVLDWFGELRAFDETLTNVKGYSRFTLRAELEEGSRLEVAVSVDGRPWRTVRTVRAGGKRVFAIPIIPTRCDSLRLRLSGRGRSRIFALTREFDIGSDNHVEI